MPGLPSGRVTYLFTDIVGSTRMWDAHPQAMEGAHARHGEIVAQAVGASRGYVVHSRGEGDSTFSVFADPADAVAGAVALQRAVLAEPWPPGCTIRVRAALHTGHGVPRDGDYFSGDVNRCARLRAIAHGGQTLVSQATCALVPGALPEGASLLPLGSHRLKDLQRPEQVYQLCHPDLPADFPALASLDRMPTNLPVQLTSFVGREQAMADVKDLLSQTRLLTISGAGGCGKTRLALQVGADLLDEYPDGVWLVELAALPDAALVPNAVAYALGVAEEPGRPVFASLRDFLLSRRLLLIVDNCEHVVETAGTLAHDLLSVCPGLRVLATSRERLAIDGETWYRLPSLSVVGGDGDDADDVARCDAVRLFVERASAVQPGFALTPGNARHVAAICRRLDGVPLAIELAAARVRAISVSQIAARLDDAFRLLTGGSRAALPRHQTLHALVDWSYALLSEPERALMRALAAFAGGWSLEAAEAVAAGDELAAAEVLEALTALVDKSMVVVREDDDTPRYGMLEVVRQYAAAKLVESSGTDAVLRRHRDWCFALLSEAGPKLSGPEQADWLSRLDLEHDNLRSALKWCIGTPAESDSAVRLACGTAPLWFYRGYFSEGRTWLSQVLALPAAQGRTAGRAQALNEAGNLADRQSDYAAARAYHEEALSIRRELGDRRGIIASLNNLGIICRYRAEYDAAARCFEEALGLNGDGGTAYADACLTMNLGLVAYERGDMPGAREHFERALVTIRQVGSPTLELMTLVYLAGVELAASDFRAVRRLSERSIELARQLGDRRGEADGLYWLAVAGRGDGDFAGSARAAHRSLALCRELGDRRGAVNALENAAETAAVAGAQERAVRLFGGAAAIREAIGLQHPQFAIDGYARIERDLRGSLGDETFDTLWAEGRGMTEEQLAECVVGT